MSDLQTFMIYFPNQIFWANVKMENEYKMVMKECVRIGFQKLVFFSNFEKQKIRKNYLNNRRENEL